VRSAAAIVPASPALHTARELSRSSRNLRDPSYPTLLGSSQLADKDCMGLQHPKLALDASLKSLHGSVKELHSLAGPSPLQSPLMNESLRSLHGSTLNLQLAVSPRVPDRAGSLGTLKPPEGIGALMQRMLNVSSEELGGCPSTGAACFYSADASDPIDVAIAKQLLTLHREASLKLHIRRVRHGLYEIDAKLVSMRWSPASKDAAGAPLLLAQELPVGGRKVKFEEISLAAYMWQAVSGIPLVAPASNDSDAAFVGLIPPDMRLTFESERTGNLLDKSNTGGDRYASMKKAVEQAKLREVAATALACSGPNGSPLKVPERGPSIGW